MTRTAIGVWLLVALLAVVLYMLPMVLKQAFVLKEGFQAKTQEIRDEWKFVQSETFVDVPKAAQNMQETPEYLQNVPGSFQVGGAGVTDMESQPASIGEQLPEVTPMQQQGMQMRKAPAAVPVEGFALEEGYPLESFQSAPPPGPSTAPPPGTSTAPPPKPTTNTEKEPDCGYEYNPDPNGLPIYTCDGKIVSPPTSAPPTLPTWLTSITSRDGIDENEAAITSYWLSTPDWYKSAPTWVKELAKAETLTESEKKALAVWAKDNTKASAQNIVQSTTKTEDKPTNSACKPACKPKPACKKPKEKEPETPKCKGPIHMGDYIRKDSIPCWACTL